MPISASYNENNNVHKDNTLIYRFVPNSDSIKFTYVDADNNANEFSFNSEIKIDPSATHCLLFYLNMFLHFWRERSVYSLHKSKHCKGPQVSMQEVLKLEHFLSFAVLSLPIFNLKH